MSRTIDFLGIGAQRSGSTWLYGILRHHPGLWLPPRKELHYFDRSPTYPSPSHLTSTSIVNRLFGRKFHSHRFRRLLVGDFKRIIRNRDLKGAIWLFRYYFGTCDDDWYISLFNSGAGKLRGEITPSYSILDAEDVAHIRNLFPELKMILILRNPVDRAWSQVCFESDRGRFTSINDIERIKEFIDHPFQSLRSNYIRTLRIWTSCFPNKQIFIGFYDDLVRNPQRFMSSILDFLGCSTERLNQEALNRKQHASKIIDAPREIKYYLAKKYYPDLQHLNAMVGGYCETWLREIEKTLTAAK